MKRKMVVDSKRIDFGICVNNDIYFDECKWYIERLIVPDGFKVGIFPLRGAESIAQAYNDFMNESKAKYKVYLHQDTFVLNRRFIFDIVSLFDASSAIGMIGVLGGVNLPSNAICYNSWNVGSTYASNVLCTFKYTAGKQTETLYRKVEAVDGMIIVTQYDIPWRDDLSLGWDFYDVSQSLEFRRAGYEVVIPNIEEPWCLHDCGVSKLKKYDLVRETIIREYGEFFDCKYECTNMGDIYEMRKRMSEIELDLLEKGEYATLFDVDRMIFSETGRGDSVSNQIHIFISILEEELKNGAEQKTFIGREKNFEYMLKKYDEIKFFIRRNVFEKKDEVYIRESTLKKFDISREAYDVIYERVSY